MSATSKTAVYITEYLQCATCWPVVCRRSRQALTSLCNKGGECERAILEYTSSQPLKICIKWQGERKMAAFAFFWAARAHKSGSITWGFYSQQSAGNENMRPKIYGGILKSTRERP